MTKKINKKRGFIALISAIIISAILMGLAFTAAGSGLFSRFDSLNNEYKRIALSLAESCQNEALLKIAQNYSYTPAVGGETVVVDAAAHPWPESCLIKSVVYGAENPSHQKVATITTTAQYPPTNGAFSSLKVSALVQSPLFAVPGRGSLRVIVNVVNDDGGTRQPSSFLIAVTAVNPYPASFSGAGGSGVLVLTDAGSYSTNITNQPSDYTAVASSECSGTIAAGNTKVCTITENDIPTTATLTVVAKIINNNGGTKLPSDFPLMLDGSAVVSGVPTTGLAPGSHTASASAAPPGYTVSSPPWGTDCSGTGSITLSAGNKKTCTITYDDVAPPSPVCADSVMILDRTGSLFSANANDDEAAAATALVNLYSGVTPLPKLGVGSIGAYPNASLPAGAASVSSSGQLSVAYTTLKNLITNMMANSSSVGSNLAAGIGVGNTELNSSRHTAGKQKVLIFVSDGDPDSPTTSTPGDTGLKAPTASAQNASGDAWSNPTGAYGAGTASDAAGHRERYSNFGFSLPGGATITGVDVEVVAYSTSATSNTTLFSDTFGTGSTDSTLNEAPAWSEVGSGAEKRASASGNDTASADGGRFAVVFDGGSICQQINAAGATALKLGYYWRGDSDANSASDLGVVEYRTGGSCSSASGWSTLQSHDLRNDTSWTTQSAFNLPAALNNSTFFVRFRASSNTNEYFRVDGISLTGQTTSTCTLGADLSWDGGSSFSGEDTQALTTSSATYTLNSWGAHSWVPADFADSKFRVRLHDTNPGPTCHVDTLITRVSYTTSINPAEAALNAADAAKLQGDPSDPSNKTQVFSIFFGSDPDGTGPLGRELMAKLASGATLNPGHQNGSALDQSATPQTSNSGFKSPTSSLAPNQWSTPQEAFVSDNIYATEPTSGEQQGYGVFGVAVPSSSSVVGIEVSTEAKSSDSSGCQIGANVSWNGGATWSSQKTGNLGGSDATQTMGATNDTWGHSWLFSETADGKFMVRLTNIDPGGSCTNNSTLSLDRVQVRLTYSTIAENTDGDNFFVSPSSNEMLSIFTAIGEKVCPAAVAPPPAPPPTKGTVLVITHLINDNGGSNASPDFTMNVLVGLNPSINNFPGSDAPGVAVTLDPGSFSIDQSASALLYAKTLGPGCSGTLNAGDVLTCSIIDDDIPPPPSSFVSEPPSPTSVNINAWQETP